VGARPTGGRHRPEVEHVACDLHHGVGEAPGQGAVIAGAGGLGQGEDAVLMVAAAMGSK
jgi:hypothetical protein